MIHSPLEISADVTSSTRPRRHYLPESFSVTDWAAIEPFFVELRDRAIGSGAELEQGRLPRSAREELVALGEASSHLPLPHSLSAVAVLAQARSMIVDLLELTGLPTEDARQLVPVVD